MAATDAGRKKKMIERWFLEAARRASAVIPDGTIEDFEEPDFKIETATGPLGVEATELLRSGGGRSSPVAEERSHQDVIRIAEELYYRTPRVTSVRVLVRFWNVEGASRGKRDMAQALVEFVKSNSRRATPYATFSSRGNLPKGVDVIHIDTTGEHWTSGESACMTAPEIYEQLAFRISAKNKLLPRYRAKLPHSAIWLLVYSSVTLSRGVPIPHGMSKWTYPSDFEKVLFFSCLDAETVEIPKGDSQTNDQQTLDKQGTSSVC